MSSFLPAQDLEGAGGAELGSELPGLVAERQPLASTGSSRSLRLGASPQTIITAPRAAAVAAAFAVLALCGVAVSRTTSNGSGSAAAPAALGPSMRDGAVFQIAADSDSVQPAEEDQEDPHGGLLPAEKGCYTITNREECCQHYDARPWDYHGSACVPSKKGTNFSNGRTCQPRCWVEGDCDWKFIMNGSNPHGKSVEGTCTTTTTKVTTTATTMTLSSTLTSTTLIPECWTEAVTFEPLNRNSTNPPAVAKSALECQELCQKEKSCFHFSFWKPGGHCYFQNVFAVPQPSRVGFVSGPKRCGQALDMTKWSDIGNDTWVPEKFDCIKVGYTLGSNILNPNVDIDKTLKGPQATLACQKACAAESDCAHFAIEFPSKACKLASAGAAMSPTAHETVIGPPTCQ
mmetsp:Transcript_135753/g.343649  ORF Transcript_135753/g.343649 Transcript_135753/m.343649 type:complete len:403 (+) Transcript_135753:125-1333(+)